MEQSKGDCDMKHKQAEQGGPGGGGQLRERSISLGRLAEETQKILVRVDLPGMDEQSLNIDLRGNVLTINLDDISQQKISQLKRQNIIGKSPGLKRCLNLVTQAANTDACVIICGETGTGKELFARAVHQNSRRAGNKFVVVDCRSLPEAQAEKLLFGQQSHHLSGFSSNPEGMVIQADRGTLFLDEVGDLSLHTQAIINQLLLEEGYCPVGSNRRQASHFRLIVATNRSLDELVRQGKFDLELLKSLQSLEIVLPPLRERIEDIEILTRSYLDKFCREYQLELKQLSPEFEKTLLAYPWPGNVRELVNTIEQTLLTAKHKKTLFPRDLPAHIRVQVMKATVGRNHAEMKKPAHESIMPGLTFARSHF